MVRTVPEPGIHRGISWNSYHQDWDAENQSTVKQLMGGKPRSTPAHVKHGIDHPKKPTAAQAKGSALHTLFLEPSDFAGLYMEGPTQDRKARNEWKKAREENPGKDLLTPKEMSVITRMRDRLEGHPEVKELRNYEWDVELSVVADFSGYLPLGLNEQEARTWALRAKGRIDIWIPELRWMIDVKTAIDGSPAGFRKAVADRDYHFQMAYYDALMARNGKRVSRALFFIVENEPPYEPAVRELDLASYMKGMEELWGPMSKWAECLETGQYPGFAQHIEPTGLPAWRLRK